MKSPYLKYHNQVTSEQTSKLYEIMWGHWIEGQSSDKHFMSSSSFNWLAWKKIEQQIVSGLES